MLTNANTTTGPKRPKVKLVSGAAGLLVGGLILAACTSAAGAAKTTTSTQDQPGQYRQAVYPVATKKLSEREQFRAERRILLNANPKVSGIAGDDRETLRLEHLGR